jgi:hypothetical protein
MIFKHILYRLLKTVFHILIIIQINVKYIINILRIFIITFIVNKINYFPLLMISKIYSLKRKMMKLLIFQVVFKSIIL